MTVGYGTEEEQQSMVGLPAAADGNSQVGIPAPTPEEIEAEKKKIEELHEELLKKKELGLYSEKELLEESGKKVLVDKGNGMVGVDAETGAQLVKANSGAWLSSSDPAYEKTLTDIAVLQAGLNPAQEGEERKKDKQGQEQQQAVHDQAVQQIQTMTAIDEGSVGAHKELDEAALQRLRQGASTPEALKIAATVAAKDGFASIVPDDHNPDDVNRLKPTAVTGRGAELAMEAVRRRKERENAEFAARMQREKEKDKNKKA